MIPFKRTRNRLVATCRVVDANLQCWLTYHSQIFNHIFVYVDDPHQLPKAVSLDDTRFTFLVGDQTLSRYDTHGIHGRVMMTQEANTRKGIEFFCVRGFEWIFHLDDDELLFVTREQLLSELSTAPNHLCFVDYEVFPCWHAEIPFEECQFFKVNGRYPFRFYANGKAAARLNANPQNLQERTGAFVMIRTSQ